MADIRLAKPVAGTTQTVPSAPDGRFIFDFPADAATLTRNGDDLVLSFEDGSSIRLQGFYTTYSKEDMPSFQVEGVESSGQDFFAALGEDLMPAAGPAAGSSASRGGRYNEYGGSDLLDGIDHLGRLDIGFGDGVEWADDQVGGWTHQNLDPEISGIIAVDGNDMTLVESGVETDGSQKIQGNVFTPGVPVVVGQVMASDPDGGRLSYSFADGSNRIVTEYGVITIDADTGVITYTLNNDDPDADSLALGETVRQDFTVRVEDGQGGKAEASFSVTIKGTNDQPEVTLDADSELGLIESGVGRTDDGQVVTAPGTEEENQAYDGSHADDKGTQQLEGKVTGADVDAGHKLWFGAVAGDKSQDGSWEGAQSPDADIFLGKDATDGDVESSEPVEGSFGHLVLNSDGTWTYTLKGEGEAVQGTASLDGETFDISSIDALPEGATITDTFTIYVKDEHGAWNLETVTITITGSNDAPSLTVGDPDGLLYESGVGRDTTTPDHRPFDKPGQPEENNPYDNDAAGTASVTGSINAADVDHGDILHFAVADGTGMTAPEGLGLTAGSQTSVTAQGHYGQLVVTETANGTASYTYTLHGNSDGIPLTFPVTVNGTTYAGLEELKQGLDWDFDGQPTLDNLPEGATVSESFTIFVQDDKGAWQQQEVSFTITGTNDQPEVTLDADSELGLIESGVGRTDDGQVVTAPGTEEENQAYDGSHADDKGTQQLEGKVTGADVDAGHKLWFGAVAGDKSQDGSWEGAQSPDADIFLGKDATDGDVESSEPVEGSFGHLVLNSDGTWTYTLKGEGEAVQGTASLDGETFDISSIDALPEGATITDTFTIYVKDEHGAWNLETVTITITGSNDKPSLEIRDGNGQILMDGAVLETIESDPADADDATSWPQLSGSFDIRDVDADAGSDQTILIAGGTHTDGDVEHATSPAAGHEPQPGHIGSEGGTQAIFTTDYGTLTVNPDGSWTYVVNSGSELVQQLDPEHPHFETFEITVVDEHGAYDTREIVIKVEGSSAFPVITDKDDLVFKEEGVYHDGSDGNTPTEAGDVVDGQGNVIPGHHQTESLSGRVDATDVDLGDQGNLSFRVDAADAQLKTDGTPAVTQPEAPKLVSTSPNGDTVYESGYGTLTFHADGTYTYELKSGAFDADGNAVNKLAQGEVLTETFTVTVRDTFGKEVSTDITITIHGTNDKPRLELGDGSDGGALHVTESGVGRHDDGAVVDGPDDELVGAPSKDGTAADEIGRYDGALTDSDKATGKDADHGAELVYGVEAGKAESPDGVDFTTDGGDVSVRGQYGSLTIGADGSYSYTLDESSDFTAGDGTQYDRLDYLNEGETLTETFTIFVRDEHGAWASKEVTVTVTGTNDRPTLDVLDGKKFFDASGKEIAVADDRLHAYGTADSAANAVVRLSGRVQASDDDRENGAGQETTDGDNHGLQFSLQGTGYDPALTSSSVWKDSSGHDLGTGPVEVSRSGDGGYVATTEYGTLTLDQYGNYTYELHEGDDDVTALGKGESVTETFVVRVVDDRGAWSEKTITITIEGTDDKPVLSDDTESALDVYEAGVWGSKRGATDPDGTFTGRNTGSQEITVSFDKQDANDTHSLVIGEGLSLGIKQPLDVTSPDGTTVVNATYTITQTADGIYTLTAIIPGVSNGEIITLGTLKLQQDGTDDELTYTFTPDQDGLNGLPQDMDLSIDIPLQVEDQNGNRSDGEHTATINIHGTNDRPTIEVTRPAPEDVYADGVGREDDGSAVATPDKTELNPEENAPYGSRPVEGQLTASDVDAGDTTFSYFVDKVGGISDSALTATVGDGRTTVTLSLKGVAVAELTLDPATGKYSLSLLDTDEARAALAPYGEDVKFDFTVYFNVRDEHGSTAQTSASQKFSIHGTNDAPEIKDASDLGLDEGMVSVAGQVSAEDADAGHKLTYGLLSDPDFGSLNGADPESVGMTTSLSNEFGTLKIDPATGKYTFYLDAESEAVISLPEGEKKELTFHVAVRDDKGAWDVKDITVTITGKDTATVFVGDAAVVPVVEAGVVPDMHPGTENQSEDGSPVASGKLEAKDYDTVDGRPNEVEYSINTTENGQMPTTSAFSKLGPEIRDAISQQFPEETWGADADIQIMQGQYGTLYLNTSTGQYFYQLDNGSDATNALKRGEIRYDDFSIHAQGTGKGDAQGADQPLKVAVKGSNDAPEVTGVTVDEGQTGLEVSDDGFTVTGIVEDGGTETVTGRIGATDVDSPDGSTAGEGSVLKYLIKVTGEDGYVGAQSGEYGYLKLNEKTGEYTFVFNNKAAQHLGEGDIGKASFTVVVLDEYNAISEEKELTFEITGKDDAPRISGSAASITEDTEISVNIQPVTITDPDAGEEQHITSIVSPDGEPVDLTTGDGPWKTEGEYGTLTVTRNEDGSLSYTYQLTEEGRNKLQYLNEDGAHTSVQENFTVTGTSGGQSVTGGITVTINGDNDAPTLELTGPDGQIVSEEDPVEVKDWNPVKGTAAGDDVDDAEGDLRYSVDDADSATAAQDGLQTIKGEFGYLTIDAQTGQYTYVVDPFSEEYQKLQTGENGKESFTITVTDPYGATGTKEIVFDVTRVEGGTGPGSVELQLQEPGGPTYVTEDGGSYEVILPPSVASGFTELKDSEGKPVKVDADDIWLVDNKGQSDIVDGGKTHVVQTEYGSLILEKGDDGQWGYRFVLNNSSDIVQSLDEGDSIEKTFYVSAGTNQVPINVTITGINDQPVIESVGHLSIEDTGGIVTGRVTTTDPDAGDVGSNEAGEGSEQNLSYAVSAVEGSGITLTPKDGQTMGAPGTYTLTKDGTDWGEFTLNKDGSYSFKPSAEAEKLLAGENANFNLTITVDDGSDAPNSSTEENLHITITGTNEAPVIKGGELTLEATEDTVITVGDKLDVSDDRVNEGNLSYSVAAGEGAASSNAGNMAAGQYGTLFINADGTYSYQLNNQMQAVQELGEDSEPLKETFTIFVKDQDGAEVAKTVTVTINGTNDAPVLSLDTPVLTIKEGSTAEVGGTASATDVDKGDTLSYALKDGTLSEETGEYAYETDYGTFYINKETGAYRFELNNTLDAVKNLRPTDVVDAKVTVVVDDGHGGVTEKELTVHIKGSDSVPEITDEGSLAIDVAEEPESTAEKDIAAEGWDHGPDGTHDDPLHYAAQGAQPVTIDGQVWQMVTGKYGTLYLDPKTGKYRYELTEDMNHLADGETATESFGKITIADSTGNKITETITVTIKGSNDAPEIAVSQPSGALAGTVTITDVDASDTHSVTFEGLRADAAGTPLSVDLATLEQEGGTTTVDVYDAGGTLIGKLELVYTKGTGTDDSLAYTFTPDEGYLNSLPVNGSEVIDFSITVSDTHDGTDTTDGLQFGVSNVNDAPVIDETLSQGPAEGNNTGTLAFTDADVRDAHSVTFGGLSADAAGTALTVPDVEGLTGDTEVPVYRDGLQIGTLTLSYADGQLSYTLSTEGFENNLPVGESRIGFDLTVTDAQGSSDTAEDLQFRVTGNGTTGGGIPAGEDDAVLRAQSERQRLAAEEAGLLTAAASFVAGITPEPADPETFLQDTVPAQENGPEALVAEEVPLPQDETVLQEEMTDLPDADVPVSETPLADDLLAEPLLFAGLENADEMPEPVEMLRFETAEDMLPAEDADPATAATPPAFSGEDAGDGGLLLPEGVEGLFGTDGNDYLRGGEGSDAIFGGAGNDIIVYDQQDYLVSGGSGIDFMVSD
ncbi:MAG: VCBS domain-containing protein, partial [Desulfovibrio piger]|uniref:VCBS domain-containing protein n=4 Tax=Desulfovibrio TaxID=872 RepID=UPI00399B4C59